MFGVVDGIYFCKREVDDLLSERIYERNIPSEPLKPEFSPRPEQTKFTVLGKQSPSKSVKCPSTPRYPNFSTNKIFYPGNAQAPWYGYAANINSESTLRNQFFALQDCDQAKYIPGTDSELYNVKVSSTPMPQPHPHLFRREDFSPHQPNTCNIAKDLFHNHTHQQLKDL